MAMTSKRSPREIARAVAAFKKTVTPERPAGRINEIARQFKIPRATLQDWVAAAAGGRAIGVRLQRADILADLVQLIQEHGPDLTWTKYKILAKHPGAHLKHWANWSDFRAEGIKASGVSVEPLAEREKRRYQDRIDKLQTQLRAAHREINAGEDVRQSIFRLAEQSIAPPAWAVPANPSRSKPGIPVLFASDFQWGEVIKPNELDGINSFNKDVARARYKKLIERTVDLCCHHMVNPDYPGIIYLRGGDMVSGDIHQELRETNDLQTIPAVLDLVEQEVAGIRVLKERFGRVWVISVPGNHGRTTIKPHAKNFVETNYDYLSACMIERELAGEDRITFRTPLSGDARFAVFGWWFLLTHGDRIGSSGGQGFVGPAATITRGMKKLVDYYGSIGQHVDWTLLGHFHTMLELEYGLSNGSLPGYSEYAKSFRMRPQPPQQWLFFVHPEHGLTCRWPIKLGPQPKIGASVPAVRIE